MRLRREFQRLRRPARADSGGWSRPRVRFFQVIQALRSASDCLSDPAPVHFAVFVGPVWGRHSPSSTRGRHANRAHPVHRQTRRRARNLIGEVYRRFEQAGLRVIAARMMHLSQRRGRGLLCRAPRASVLQGPGEVHDFGSGHGPGSRGRERHRQEPRRHGRHGSEKGGPGTIRADLASSIDENIVHGSDAAGHGGARDRLLLPRN